MYTLNMKNLHEMESLTTGCADIYKSTTYPTMYRNSCKKMFVKIFLIFISSALLVSTVIFETYNFGYSSNNTTNSNETLKNIGYNDSYPMILNDFSTSEPMILVVNTTYTTVSSHTTEEYVDVIDGSGDDYIDDDNIMVYIVHDFDPENDTISNDGFIPFGAFLNKSIDLKV